jgi:hypothetical protein
VREGRKPGYFSSVGDGEAGDRACESVSDPPSPRVSLSSVGARARACVCVYVCVRARALERVGLSWEGDFPAYGTVPQEAVHSLNLDAKLRMRQTQMPVQMEVQAQMQVQMQVK